uniref:Actin-related protein 6 n=1 Tax=Esox lucius TaxID=8010 RepID=A0A3P8XGA1_ESOLU
MATLVLDNGAYSAKIGYSHEKVSVIPNCQFRSKTSRLKTFTANQLDEIKDPSGLFYILPFQKGYLVNWDVQRKVWDHLFGKEMFKVDFADTSVVITEPYFNFTSIQESMNEILFEEYQFQAALRINALNLMQHSACSTVLMIQKQVSDEKHPGWMFNDVLSASAGSLSAHRYFHENSQELCCIVVDSGFSFTHIVPYCRGKKMKDGICRINVGGKLLTNHLKEIISYRQLHVMDETHVINQVKEDVCYVSQDFYNDMHTAQLKGEDNTVMRDYVLPDFSSIKKGFCKPREEMNFTGKYKSGEQILRLANERFAVPEMLFHPSDIGIQEMGIPEALVNSINNMPEEMQPHFYKNIVLTGGNTLFPGFRDRVYKEVRSLAPTDFQVSVVQPPNPISYPWEGGKLLAENPDFDEMVVTREDYEENGHFICEEKFDI